MPLSRSAQRKAETIELADHMAGPSPTDSLETLQKMLDDMPINVITCDIKDFRINYANAATVRTLSSLEHLMPCKADDLIGQTIDIFHKNPEHQRRLLSNPANLPHQANIKLGDEVLDLLVTALRDSSGEYVGCMLTWSIVTDKVKADADAARLSQMVENMPVNVMMCDPEDFTVTYANQTSIKTLTTIEDLLPIKAKDLIGQCIDIFHKNPEHQRRLLSDPSNLPYRTLIKLGDHTLALAVFAVNDREGKYLGPMLTWNVVTGQVSMTEKVKQVMTSAATEMQSTAETMAAASEETNRQASAVAAASEEASTNVQTVSSAAEELSNSIQEISQQVGRSAEIAKNSVAEASRTNETIQTLAEAAEKIGNVVAIINDIASQTKLLALNATIEAARAGDAGKGFAVVASEVKNLADQTAKATTQISSQVGEMQSVTNEAVGAIARIAETIGEIDANSTAIASAVEEQGAATQEIARNVQQAAAGTQEVSTNIISVTEAATQTGSAASQMLNAAQDLGTQATELSKELEDFVRNLSG